MKNKKFTYLLGAAVLLVWGLILYRVFAAVSTDDTPIASSNINSQSGKNAGNDYALTKDTTHLLLNYRDPFHEEPVKDTTKVVPVHKLIRQDEQLKRRSSALIPQPNWNMFRYTGYIRNPHSKKLIALISYNGKSIMLGEGESSGEVKLLKNLRDSIKIAYNGKTKFISMNNGQ